jgi:hypothetical protein
MSSLVISGKRGDESTKYSNDDSDDCYHMESWVSAKVSFGTLFVGSCNSVNRYTIHT